MASQPAAESPLTAAFRARGIPLAEVTPGFRVPSRFDDPAGEQLATRRAAGLYDFSFMAVFEVAGAGARAFLDRVQTRDAGSLRPGRIAYTLLLDDDGTVFVDATLWRFDDGRYWLVSGRPSDRSHVEAVAAGFDVQLRDLSGSFAVAAVQGPASAWLLRRCGASSLPGYFRFGGLRVAGLDCRIARLGYTGELGYEIFVDTAAGARLWRTLCEAGSELDARECGFDAADALRIESGFVLFSRELRHRVTPAELGYARLADPAGAFRGAAALRARGRRPPRRMLVGLRPMPRPDRAPALPLAMQLPLRHATPGRGVLTSAAVSALHGETLGLGFVDWSDRHPGTRVELGYGLAARVARLPYYDPLRRLPRLDP
ncbi:MAG: aminomethyltransferase family protein [Pseudomonadota bacterium]